MMKGMLKRWLLAMLIAFGVTSMVTDRVASAKTCKKCRSDCKKAVKDCKNAVPKAVCKVAGVSGVCKMFKKAQCKASGYICRKVGCDTGTCDEKKKRKKRKKRGRSLGDPHLYSFDGLRFDLQTAGEYVLARSQKADVEVQIRFTPAGDQVSVVTMVAMRHGGRSLVFERNGNRGTKANVFVDGVKVKHPERDLIAGSDFFVRRTEHGAFFVVAGSTSMLVHIRAHPIDVTLMPDESTAGDWVGLLGDFNGSPDDDLRARSGEVVTPGSMTPAILHRTGSDSWRLTQAESILRYERGASTATHTDRTFPKAYISLASLGAAAIETARVSCLAAGTSGEALRNCIYDVAATGELTYADSYTGLAIDAPTEVVGAPDPTGLAPASLLTDASVRAGDSVTVIWTGPDGPGDALDIVKMGATDTATSIGRGALGDGSTIDLRAPGRAGNYLVRYVTGRGGKVIATTPLRVTDVNVTLHGPKRVVAGSSFEVTWQGLDHATDAVAILKRAATDPTRTIQLQRTDELTHTRLRAPKVPGDYDVVYILRAGDGRRIVARHPFEVVGAAE